MKALLSPLLFPALPFPAPLAPSSSLPLGLALCAPTALSPSPCTRLSAHPLAEAAFPGRAVLCSHLASLSEALSVQISLCLPPPSHSSGRWTDKAEAPGPLPPAPGLGRQARAPLATHPQPRRRVAPSCQGFSRGPKLIRMGPQRAGRAGIYRGPAPGSTPCQVPVESHEGQTGAMQRLCSPRSLASLPLKQEKSAVTGPGRPGPGGRRAAHTAPLPTYGCCRPGALLGRCRLKLGGGSGGPSHSIPPTWPGCSL